MSDGSTRAEDRVAELRREFDRTFLALPHANGGDSEDLLAVRVGGDPYALRVREVAGVEACPRIVPLPSRVPELLGLAGIRGGLVPVYGLAALLGYGRTVETVRWLVLCGGEETVGLGLVDFEGYLRVPQSELHAAGGDEFPRAHVREGTRAGGTVRAVISVPSLLQTIKGRVGTSGPPKER